MFEQSLTFHHIRTLIHRPLACSSMGNRASISIVALAQSSKHIVQIVQLLEERRMSFSFCLNKNHILTMAGFGLLFQTIDFDRKGKLIQDSERLLCSVASILERNCAPGTREFKNITCSMISIHPATQSVRTARDDSLVRRISDPTMPAPKSTSKSSRKLQASASGCSLSKIPLVKKESNGGRRFTAPTLPTPLLSKYDRTRSQNSVLSVASEPLHQSSRRGLVHAASLSDVSEPLVLPNLDYLDFSNEPATGSCVTSPTIVKSPVNMTGIEMYDFKADLHHQQSLDIVYPAPDVFSYLSDSSSASNAFDWCSDAWAMPTDMNDQIAQSSFSEEELTSGEELSSCGTSGHFTVGSLVKENGLVALDASDGAFGL